MISFPNAKINLGLNITGKREDGYHNLETIFYPVKIYDVLEILRSTKFEFSSTGLPIDDDSTSNLCVKAYHLLKKDFPLLPSVHAHLHKAIPMGAGLGGGSADGAFMLSMLNKKFELALSQEGLSAYALALGSDCPFFVRNKPSFATGRGEQLQEVDLDLSTFSLVVINPGIHVSTAIAFASLTPAMPAQSAIDIIRQPVETWKEILKNDFETTVFSRYPEVKKIKQQLYEHGAVYASMSGSGSSVYGLFSPAEVHLPSFPAHYKMYIPE